MFSLIENYILSNNLEDVEILFSELIIYEKNIEFYQEKDIDVNIFFNDIICGEKIFKRKKH